MTVPVELPELGESVVEGTIARWFVKEGDRVDVDQLLVEVTTDKVDAEIPSPVSGFVESVCFAEGETVLIGAVLLTLRETGEPVDAGKTDRKITESTAARDLTRATPVASRLAEDMGVDLSGISGSGVGGRVNAKDVRNSLEKQEHSPENSQQNLPSQEEPQNRLLTAASNGDIKRRPYASVEILPEDKVIPMTPLRKLVAEHMVYSKRTSPHVGTVAEIDLGNIVSLRKMQKKRFRETYGTALTFLPFIVHATVRALTEFPSLNASVIEDAIVQKKDINIGIAVETEKGLVVPVVRSADRLSLPGLATAIEEVSSRARNKRLLADDLKNGTFTVSNPGRNGNLYGFAIINQPQVGIVRMGEIVKRPVVRTIGGEDAIVIRPMMHLSLSYDHRAVDGSPANAFLFRIRELLEEGDFDF